jgi:arabinofuranosyltransferase
MPLRIALALLFLLFVAAFLQDAWVVDDAYITFRVIDNFVNGRGLTWNPGERVQVFTHPLWMLTMSAVYALSGDFFHGHLWVSLALCLAMLAVATRWLAREGELWRPALFIGLLLSSKAVMDYTSSGLENALSYLLAALFCARLPADAHGLAEPRRLLPLALIASLAFLNRHDTLLLYLPALGWLALRGLRREGAGATLPPLLLASLPAAAWLVFATLYYGFPLPNTWYAKVASGIPLADRLVRGLLYFGNSLVFDAATHLAVGACLVLALRRRHVPALLGLAGVGLYYGYILLHASATHMSGRFFSVPFCLALLLLAKLWPSARAAGFAALALLAFNLGNPIAPLKMGTRWYHPRPLERDRLDTSYYVHRDGPHLLWGHRGDPGIPDVEFFARGLEFRAHPARVHVGGQAGREAIGFFAFAAGPEKIVVDYLGLADPLLARLAACNTDQPAHWKSGHFYRIPPRGYLATVASGENRIDDPGVRAYYDHLARVVRGPDLLDPERLATILRLNLGCYDDLLEAHQREVRRTLAGRDCRQVVARMVGPLELP